MSRAGRCSMRISQAAAVLMIALPLISSAGPEPGRKDSVPLSERGVMTAMKDKDFRFTYTSRGGVNAAMDMQMWETRITVDSGSGKSTLDMNRDHGDDAGLPIGRFEMSVEKVALERLRVLLGSADFSGLMAEGTYEMFNESLMTMTYETAQGAVTKTVGSGERNWVAQLEPLLTEVHALQSELRSHPKAALQLAVRHVIIDRKEHFELVLANIGSMPVSIIDPRSITGEREWAGIKVAVFRKEESGTIPASPSWERIPLLPGMERGGPAYIRIEPGSRHVVQSLPWHPEQCGVSYGAQGTMINYGGPREKDGLFVVRGGLFSAIIGVVSCKDGEASVE